MLKDINGIKFKGANFDSLTDILFFDAHEGNKVKKVKGALLYGRNGAGKSTLAKAVKKVKGDTQETIVQASFVDVNNNLITLDETEKEHIFVFDEEYVDKNVKLQENGLNTIIMLGQQAEIEEQIQEARIALEKAKVDQDAQRIIVEEYCDVDNNKSPKHYLRELRWALQGDDCWSGRDKQIKGNRQNTGVRDDTYKQFVSISTSKTRDQLIIEYNETLKELRIAQQGDAIISAKVSSVQLEYDEEYIIGLLKTKIEKPELSERECYLLDLVQLGRSSQLNIILDTFSDESIKKCPTCFQKVTKEYKQDLVHSIQKVLSKVVEEHQKELRAYVLQEIDINLVPFTKLSINYGTCLTLIDRINEAIRKNNIVVQSKIDDPFTPCEQEISSISELLLQLNEALEGLETERHEYNKKITATQPITDKLIEINNSIAHYDIQDSYLHYLAAEVEQKKEEETLNSLKELYLKAKDKVDELEAKQKNVEVAISIINNNLKYIFFSNNRFVIDYRNENYVLLSNGKTVKPSQISQGERNIIGLCYFFASILQNQEEATAYKSEYLLVIDDPVSSFDIENRTGIMSFLRYQLGKLFLGNEHTKAVIMTHDLLTYYDSEKIIGELIDSCNCKFGGEKQIFKRWELKQKELIQFAYNGRQEYTELVKTVYNFALGDADEYEIVIGNIMRQMLEAFSTFQYKKGIDEVSRDQNILACLPEEEYRGYFENLMYRLILNSGSHRLEQTKSMEDLNFFTVISKDEKKRTAKEILSFIYLLNEQHLLSHLVGCSNVESNLSQWCKDIKNTIGK